MVPFASQQEAYALLGGHDEFLRLLAEGFDCQMVSRGDGLSISGEEQKAEAAALVVRELQHLYRQGTTITAHEVRYAIRLIKAGEDKRLHALFSDTLLVTARGRHIRPKTLGQQRYLEDIWRWSGRDGKDVFGRRFGGPGVAGERDSSYHSYAPGGGGRRAIGFFAGRYAGEGGSVSAAPLRRTGRYFRIGYVPEIGDQRDHRDRAFGVHAGTNAGQRLYHFG